MSETKGGLKLLKFTPPEPEKIESGEGVIQLLEEALELAKDGQLANVFIVAATTDKNVMRSFANTHFPFAVIGATEYGIDEFKAAAFGGGVD